MKKNEQYQKGYVKGLVLINKHRGKLTPQELYDNASWTLGLLQASVDALKLMGKGTSRRKGKEN